LTSLYVNYQHDIILDCEYVLSLYKPLEVMFLGLGLLTVFNSKIDIYARQNVLRITLACT